MRLEVTRKTDLGVRALRVLHDTGERLKGPALAEAVGSSSGFVSQVLTPLVHRGWVRSDPGPTGGYSLAVNLEDLSLLAVVEAIEGATESGRCVLADRPCSDDGPCALHTSWMRARDVLLHELDSITIAEAVIPAEVG